MTPSDRPTRARRDAVHDSVLGLVGDTPTVRLGRLSAACGSELLVKLEGANPGRSVKDRAALSMVEQAERDGRLRPGATIVESTSGNMGKSLAMIGAVKGYRVLIVVDPKAPRSVLDFLRAYGAQIETVDTPDEQGGYQLPRIRRVHEIVAADPSVFWPNQYVNRANPRVHAERTAHELLRDVGAFDALVAPVSTGGHLTGLATTLRATLPDLVTVAVDAYGSAAFGDRFRPYVMRGLGLAWTPGNLDRSLVDELHRVSDAEGLAAVRVIAAWEGLLLGESSGAAIFAALHHASRNPGTTVVTVSADDGANYLGESFDDSWLRARGVAREIRSVEELVAAAGEPEHAVEHLGGRARAAVAP